MGINDCTPRLRSLSIANLLERERDIFWTFKMRCTENWNLRMQNHGLRSKTTLKNWMMVEGHPNLKEEVSSSILDCETSSLLDINLQDGQLPPLLWRWHVGLLSLKKTAA